MTRFHLSDRHAGDLQSLIDSRLLIQANSGGGKSWCIRRLLEQTHGHVQHLVIDPEGEFATLREKFDYVLAAKNGGDTAADPRTARLLAERLLELGVSAILDIYELKAHERIRFVHEFLDALVNAPKKLWHPALVVVDEAHVFCPESSKAESQGAVIDLATRGRKRGFCAVLATQRLSKLAKDAAAECNNKLIGRTGLDVDVKRAADELGLTKERWRELRELEPGEFFAFGPAISREVIKVTIGPVVTRHPKAGARLAVAPPPPTEKVKALLPKLSDLPAEVEERQRTTEDLKKRIRELEGQLRARPTEQVEKVKVEQVRIPVLEKEDLARLERAIDALAQKQQVVVVEADLLTKAIQGARQDADAALATIHGRASTTPPRASSGAPSAAPPGSRVTKSPAAHSGNGRELTDTQQRILDTIAMLGVRGIGADRVSVARWMGIHPNGGRYGTDLARLREAGYLEERGTVLTPAGAARAQALPTGEDAALRAAEVIDGSCKTALEKIVESKAPLTREGLAELLGIHPNGGRYGTNLARLREMGLIPERGEIRATEAVFR